MSTPAETRIVPLLPEHLGEVMRVDQAAFAFDPTGVDPATATAHFEWDRTFGAVRPRQGPARQQQTSAWAEHEELAGIFTVYSMGLTVPGAGGRVLDTAMAGLSWVGVHPDHRRQGVLKAMMHRHLHDLHDQAREPVSGLFASQAEIYGRFGYGQAASGVWLRVPAGARLHPLPPGPDAPTVRVRTQMFAASELPDVIPLLDDLLERARHLRPGGVTRPGSATAEVLRERPGRSEGREPMQVVVASADDDPDTPTGYALVKRRAGWTDGLPDGSAEVVELFGTDPATLHALWTRVLAFDLVTSVETPVLAADDPLLAWLVDPRSPLVRRTDGQWLRLVDVDRALAARGYAGDINVVLDLSDELCPWNAGRWRLRVRGDVATCTRTEDSAQVTLDVRELATVYLGGVSLCALAAAGLVHGRDASALLELSTAMRGWVDPVVCQMY